MVGCRFLVGNAVINIPRANWEFSAAFYAYVVEPRIIEVPVNSWASPRKLKK